MNTRQHDIDTLKASYQPWIDSGAKTLKELQKQIQSVKEAITTDSNLHALVEFVDHRSGSYILNDLNEDAETINSLLLECGDITF